MKEKIIDGYIIKPSNLYTGKYRLMVEKPTGETIEIYGRLDAPILIGKNKIKTTRRELIKQIFNPTEEQMCVYEYRYGLRTKKYLDVVAANIGFIYFDVREYDIIKNETTKDYSGGFDNANTIITKSEENYIVQILHWHGEGTCVYMYTFNHYPTRKEFKTAYKIEKLKEKFFMGQLKENFVCWECGKKVHWLDRTGSLDDKIDGLEDSYCGCDSDK